MAEEDPVASVEVAAEAPRPAGARLRPALIGIALLLAFAARVFSFGRPGRTPDPRILALLLLPFAVLAYWTYTRDTGRGGLFRILRAALFSFLVIEAFYWGVSIGGAAAAIGAYAIYTRVVRPKSAPQ